MVFRSIFRASGRKITLEAINIPAAVIAITVLSELAKIPTAVVHHKVAAVLIPRTEVSPLKITPLHKKPTPAIMLLATRNISCEPYINGNNVKKLVPRQIKTLMRIPAGWPVSWRSKPIQNPRNNERKIRKRKSPYVMGSSR